MPGIRFHYISLIYQDPIQATEDRPAPSVGGGNFMVDSVSAKRAAMDAEAHVTFGPLSFEDWVPEWRSAWLRHPAGNIVQITQSLIDKACRSLLLPE